MGSLEMEEAHKVPQGSKELEVAILGWASGFFRKPSGPVNLLGASVEWSGWSSEREEMLWERSIS